jgi:hypothetical protein
MEDLFKLPMDIHREEFQSLISRHPSSDGGTCQNFRKAVIYINLLQKNIPSHAIFLSNELLSKLYADLCSDYCIKNKLSIVRRYIDNDETYHQFKYMINNFNEMDVIVSPSFSHISYDILDYIHFRLFISTKNRGKTIQYASADCGIDIKQLSDFHVALIARVSYDSHLRKTYTTYLNNLNKPNRQDVSNNYNPFLE